MTVRAEMSRLRKHLVGILAAQPYRFGDDVALDLVLPVDLSRLLPHSSASTITASRAAVSAE